VTGGAISVRFRRAAEEEPMEPLKTPTRYPDLSDPQARPRYTGIATFFRVPHTEDLGAVDIGLIGVPVDAGVTNRSGARHGPRAVREQSTLLRRYNAASGAHPFEGLRVRDLGDAWIEQPYELQGVLAEIEAVFRRIVAAGVAPVSVGGDHAISLPILRAVGAARPIGMVHVDAHADTGDDYLGSRYHHGAPFRRAAEEGLLDPKRVIQIGIRGSSNDTVAWEFSRQSGMAMITADEFADRGWHDVAQQALRVVGAGPVYLSFDIDSLDPVFAPGTGTPEAGGLSVHHAQRLLRALGPIDFVGGDLVEVAPAFDPSYLTAFHGASILFEILCLVSEARKRRAGV
jgi:guanidinopropionase